MDYETEIKNLSNQRASWLAEESALRTRLSDVKKCIHKCEGAIEVIQAIQRDESKEEDSFPTEVVE